MIAEYESEERPASFEAPRMYGLNQKHKHLPEIQKLCGLQAAPVFCPVVAPYYAGMEVVVPLFREWTSAGLDDIRQIYQDYYRKGLVHFEASEENFLSACDMAGFDDMEISVFGNDDRILLVSRFDNLGKGASGAAIQNLNICLGLEESLGLNLKFGGKEI